MCLCQPEWFISNTGSILAGAIPAGIYATNSAEACYYISDHSKASLLVVEGNKQLVKYVGIASNLPSVKAIVVWGKEPVDPALAQQCGSIPVFSWENFMTLGSKIENYVLDARGALIKPGNCATLIYTSGTTGPPKACMISHDNLTWTTRNIVDNYIDLNHEDRFVSYLPLSHIAAQMIDIHCPMCTGASIYFAQPDVLKGSLTGLLREVRPTLFFAVPRVWEKIQEKMAEMARQSSAIKRALGHWAKSVGADHSARMQYGQSAGGTSCLYGCANSLVLSKIKGALGLDQCKACFTGAAAIGPETLMYFASLDIPVFELFGQSESTGPHTLCVANAWKVGSCGRPMKGTESKCAPGTNELCFRGRHVFMGYMYMPEKTAETFDSAGFLKSGDVAVFDADDDRDIPEPSGFMTITGRIKELIKTSGGENIPPVLIENEMKVAMAAVSNCMLIGNKRKFLALLISLKVEVDSVTGLPSDLLASDALFVGSQIGSIATTFSAAQQDPLWTKYINQGVSIGNSKAISAAQNVQKWAWLPEDFSEKAGELTPTLKLKRNFVEEKYSTLINGLYADMP